MPPSPLTINQGVFEYGGKAKEFIQDNMKDIKSKIVFPDGTKTHSQKEGKSKNEVNVVMGWDPVNGKIPLDISVNTIWEKNKEKTNKIKHMHNKKMKKETVKEIKLLKIEVRELKREQKESEKIIERISNIFKADTVKKARTRFNILFNNMKHLAQIIGKFLNKLKKKT